MTRCIPPPAPIANDNACDSLYPSQRHVVPVDVANPDLTEAHALLSDVGSYAEWVALALRLKKSERSGRTGVGRKKRRTG